jgi:hypothetical protein
MTNPPALDIAGPPAGYQAGACNIGPDEIAYRRRGGYAGVAVAVVLGVVLVVIDAPPVARLLVAIPLAGGILSLWQARSRFCAGFGLAGVANFDERTRENVRRIEDEGARAADRRRAIRMFVVSSVVGIAIAILFTLAPI